MLMVLTSHGVCCAVVRLTGTHKQTVVDLEELAAGLVNSCIRLQNVRKDGYAVVDELRVLNDHAAYAVGIEAIAEGLVDVEPTEAGAQVFVYAILLPHRHPQKGRVSGVICPHCFALGARFAGKPIGGALRAGDNIADHLCVCRLLNLDTGHQVY